MTNQKDSSNVVESSPEERGYIEGRSAAHRHAMLYHARELGIFHAEDPNVALAYKTDELARARKQLRELSERLGCNDWEDSLDLGDVVEKHVARAVDDLGTSNDTVIREKAVAVIAAHDEFAKWPQFVNTHKTMAARVDELRVALAES